MLFIFDQPGYYPFWMKDMRFPIDIAWLNVNKQVVEVQANLAPSSYPQTFTNPSPALYVLEIKAGQAAKLNLVTGTSVKF